ncbi:MAG: hypothetical protein JOZ72_03695 [Alphaproteobacteria bacterium]|nr:hypothetical protein [Alphaproteobacteria bacterium]
MTRGIALFPAYATAAVSRGIREAFGEVAALLFGSATFSPRPAVESDVHELVEPHLAILVHKRSRYAPERWAGELDGFVRRTFFWPEPAVTEAFGRLDRHQLATLVDRIVANEQDRQAEAAALPQTSRFDSSWAD